MLFQFAKLATRKKWFGFEKRQLNNIPVCQMANSEQAAQME
jgi:hypothetical protein